MVRTKRSQLVIVAGLVGLVGMVIASWYIIQRTGAKGEIACGERC